MQTWCIYIDESGVPYADGQPNFIYVAICVPFSSQQEFLEDYPKIVEPLVSIFGDREIKYGEFFKSVDGRFKDEYTGICNLLLERFFQIEDAKIIRVKAIKKEMRLSDEPLRAALFGKTLELCNNYLPQEHRTMVLHDELPSRKQQIPLFERFKKYSNFQNCIFVHSDENPFIQFADFVASVCYRYYDPKKNKEKWTSLVKELFEKINKYSSDIVELPKPRSVDGNSIKEQASQLASERNISFEEAFQKLKRKEAASQLVSEHDILLETAYNIVDENITLDEVSLRKQRRNENRSYTQALADLLRNPDKL